MFRAGLYARVSTNDQQTLAKVMRRPKRDPAREDRIHNEAIVDARLDPRPRSGRLDLPSGLGAPHCHPPRNIAHYGLRWVKCVCG